jgi:hypothetical protein
MLFGHVLKFVIRNIFSTTTNIIFTIDINHCFNLTEYIRDLFLASFYEEKESHQGRLDGGVDAGCV